MAELGTYCNGDPFVINPPGGTGIRFTSIAPASKNVAGRQINGAMINPGEAGPGFADIQHGFDSLPSSPDQPYNPAVNVDPGNTSAPLHFAAGAEGSVVKAVSNPAPTEPYRRDKLLYAGVITVCAAVPPPRAFRPGIASPSKISHWVEDDMDLSGLRSLSIPPGFSVGQFLARQRWIVQSWSTANDPGRSLVPMQNHESYGSNFAAELADAILALSLDIDPTYKRDLAVALTQRGIDIYERLQGGGNFNVNGGGWSSRKLPLAVAAYLLDDARMQAKLGNPPGLFVEDDQYVWVSATDVSKNGYPAGNLGAPEWAIRPVHDTLPDPDPDARYRAVNTRWQAGAALGLQLLGARTCYNNEPFFGYADRIMERTFHRDGGSDKWALSLSGTNSPTNFHRAMWAAYRAAPDMPPVWDWPAP